MCTARTAGASAFETPTALKVSPSYYNGTGDAPNEARWGDWAGVWPDPVDNTFWVTHEWAKSNSSDDWSTWIANVSIVNTPPTISSIANQTINEDGATSAIAFTIGDAETSASGLTVAGSSSNTTLVPNANISLGGSGASRTVTVTPSANQFGTATIT